jgi:hypothetical protein
MDAAPCCQRSAVGKRMGIDKLSSLENTALRLVPAHLGFFARSGYWPE